MRITIVTGPFQPLPPLGCGAVEQIWFALAQELAMLGNSVQILSCDSRSQRSEEIVNKVKIFRFKQYKSTSNIWVNLFKDLNYSIRIILKLPHSDILILNTFWLPILTGYFRNKKWGKLNYNVQRFPKNQIKFYKRIDRFSAVSTAISHAVSNECPLVKSKIKVINNPINTQVFKPPVHPRKYDNCIKIIYTGRIHPEKGIHLLIEAFRELYDEFPNLKLQIVGPVDVSQGGGGVTYYNHLKMLSGDHSVQFLPPVFDQQQLAQYLHNAHIYCYPSLADKGESFGVAPLEAMGTALPVIVSDLECFKDFIEDGKTGLVFDHRTVSPAKNLYNAIHRLLNSRELCVQLGMSAAEKAKEFNMRNIAKLYLADFVELLGNNEV